MTSVVLFDLDETLVAQERAFAEAYRSVAEWLAEQVPDLDPAGLAELIPDAATAALARSPIADTVRCCCFGGRDILWGKCGPVSQAEGAIAEGADELRAATWDIAIAGVPNRTAPIRELPALIPGLNLRFRDAMFSALSAFPDVYPVLDDLAGRYRLAVVTNGMATAQREKIDHLGLGNFFERVIASTDVGEGKPSSQIFAAALEAMDVSADDALMVGDSLDGDVRGAERAGVKAVWIDRGSAPRPTGTAPIRNLGELCL